MYCARPHPKEVDFGGSRFVVASAEGLLVGDTRYQRGDELPRGILDARALRLEYQVHRIELADHAATVPALVEACAAKGVSLGVAAPSQEPPRAKYSGEQLAAMSRKQLVEACESNALSSTGNKDELVERLSAVVA